MRVMHMDICDVVRKHLVVLARGLVENEEEEVKTRQQGGRKIDILDWGGTSHKENAILMLA